MNSLNLQSREESQVKEYFMGDAMGVEREVLDVQFGRMEREEWLGSKEWMRVGRLRR